MEGLVRLVRLEQDIIGVGNRGQGGQSVSPLIFGLTESLKAGRE